MPFTEIYQLHRLHHFVERMADGRIRGVIPNSCGERREVVADLFGTTEVVTQCEGCLKDDIRRHNGVYCQIKDWHATDKATGKRENESDL